MITTFTDVFEMSVQAYIADRILPVRAYQLTTGTHSCECVVNVGTTPDEAALDFAARLARDCAESWLCFTPQTRFRVAIKHGKGNRLEITAEIQGLGQLMAQDRGTPAPVDASATCSPDNTGVGAGLNRAEVSDEVGAHFGDALRTMADPDASAMLNMTKVSGFGGTT